MIVSSLLGLALQVVPLLLGLRSASRALSRARSVMDENRAHAVSFNWQVPEGSYPHPPASTNFDVLFLREVVTIMVLDHSWRNVRRGVWSVVIGAAVSVIPNLVSLTT